jgi:hypothetical protein
MAANQTSYTDVIAVGTPGMVANSQPTNIISRTLSGSNLAFGLPVLRGSTDHACILAAQEGRTAAGAAGVPAPAAATITAAPTADQSTKLGVHRFECIVGGATTTSKWRHTDPDGDFVGIATGNTAYAGGGLSGLTITDAGTDPTAGEAFSVTVTATSDLGDFLGLSVRDTTLGAEEDVYEAGDTVAVLDEGVMWVTAGATVTPADKPYWNPSTSRYTKTATHLEIPGATFESSGGNGDLVKLKLRKTAPR